MESIKLSSKIKELENYSEEQLAPLKEEIIINNKSNKLIDFIENTGIYPIYLEYFREKTNKNLRYITKIKTRVKNFKEHEIYQLNSILNTILTNEITNLINNLIKRLDDIIKVKCKELHKKIHWKQFFDDFKKLESQIDNIKINTPELNFEIVENNKNAFKCEVERYLLTTFHFQLAEHRDEDILFIEKFPYLKPKLWDEYKKCVSLLNKYKSYPIKIISFNIKQS